MYLNISLHIVIIRLRMIRDILDLKREKSNEADELWLTSLKAEFPDAEESNKRSRCRLQRKHLRDLELVSIL